MSTKIVKEFTCPECGNHDLEEVMKDVTVISVVETISVEDGVADLSYSQQIHEEGEVVRYQCQECDYVLQLTGEHDVSTAEELGTWLEQSSG